MSTSSETAEVVNSCNADQLESTQTSQENAIVCVPSNNNTGNAVSVNALTGTNKIILCQQSQDGQLFLTFAPANTEKAQIVLFRNNAVTTSNAKDQVKLALNLNPASKMQTETTASLVGDVSTCPVVTTASSATSIPTTCSSTASSSGVANSLDATTSVQNSAGASDKTKKTAGDSIYVCSFTGCGRSFPSLPLLSCHQALHKAQSKKADLVCQICKLKFAWPSHYKYHLLTHNNERAYQCYVDGCGKRFYTMQRLDVHLRTHTGERPYRCDNEGCGKSFTTKGNLRNHQRIHSGEKPYKCTHEGCTSAFAEFSSLRKHKLVHSGEKPFACEFCDKVFSQSGSRNIHMNKNHAARKQHAMAINAHPTATEAAISATIDSAMVVESQQNILVLAHYDDKMLHFQEQGGEHVVTVSTQSAVGNDPLNLSHSMLNSEESLQTEVEGLGSRSNVVVLSQPEELVNMGEAYQSATHEEIVYDNDILNSDLDQDQIASSSLSIQQDLENEPNESHSSSDHMIVSILDSSSIKKKVF